jgi:hypothetical protein
MRYGTVRRPQARTNREAQRWWRTGVGGFVHRRLRGSPLRRPRYGDDVFTAAAALPVQGGLGHPSRLVALLAAAIRHPRRLVALAMTLLGTRRVSVHLSRSDAGLALRAYFDQRFLRVFPQNRMCRGVLALPGDHAAYLRGRRRQALRTNLRRAAAAGIVCAEPGSADEALAAAATVLADRRAASTDGDNASLNRVWPELFRRPGMTLFVASSHDARWALHDHLVQLLIERGVRYLLAEGIGPLGALGYDAELHYYQRLLGYELMHLVPVASVSAIAAAGVRRSAPRAKRCAAPRRAGIGVDKAAAADRGPHRPARE